MPDISAQGNAYKYLSWLVRLRSSSAVAGLANPVSLHRHSTRLAASNALYDMSECIYCSSTHIHSEWQTGPGN